MTQSHIYGGVQPSVSAVKLISSAPHKPLLLPTILHKHALQVNMLGQKLNSSWSNVLRRQLICIMTSQMMGNDEGEGQNKNDNTAEN